MELILLYIVIRKYLKENVVKLILTYKTNVSITTWFKCKHTYLLTTIGLLKDSDDSADFNHWVSTETIKRIRKPTCD